MKQTKKVTGRFFLLLTFNFCSLFKLFHNLFRIWKTITETSFKYYCSEIEPSELVSSNTTDSLIRTSDLVARPTGPARQRQRFHQQRTNQNSAKTVKLSASVSTTKPTSHKTARASQYFGDHFEFITIFFVIQRLKTTPA
jgi:hypothetical protein